ncbi:MAG: hypothetical protein ACLRNW_09070 [Neglectibacter sp.]
MTPDTLRPWCERFTLGQGLTGLSTIRGSAQDGAIGIFAVMVMLEQELRAFL